MKRRTFIRNTIAGSALLAAFPYETLALQEKLYAHDRIKLGNTGIKMSRMAMGTGTHGKPCPRRKTCGLSPLRVLAEYGYLEG